MPDMIEIEIPADILKALDESRQGYYNAYHWQPWQDKVLLEYWGRFSESGLTQNKLCGILASKGCVKPSTNTARKRYRELIDDTKS